jgi:hypothetical protein
MDSLILFFEDVHQSLSFDGLGSECLPRGVATAQPGFASSDMDIVGFLGT